MSSSSRSQQYLSQIVYPSSELIHIEEDAYVIGWNVEQFQCCAAGTVPKSSYTLHQLKEILAKVHRSCNFVGGSRPQAQPSLPSPVVLGEFYKSSQSQTLSETNITDGLWISLSVEDTTNRLVLENEFGPQSAFRRQSSEHHNKSIKLKGLFSLGCRYDTSCYLIGYNSPNTDHFDHIFLEVEGLPSRQQLTLSTTRTEKMSADLETITLEINASHDLNKFVKAYSSNQHIVENKVDVEQFILRMFSNAATLAVYVTNLTYSFLCMKLPLLTLWYRKFTWNIVVALNIIRPSPQTKKRPSSLQIIRDLQVRELSFVLFVLAIRCRHILLLFRLAASMTLIWNNSTPLRSRLWLKSIHSVILLLVDIFFGILLSLVVYQAKEVIWLKIEEYSAMALHMGVLDILNWFNNNPGGVKLNPMITQKVSTVVSLILRRWSLSLSNSKHVFHFLVKVWIGCGGCGISFQIAMLLDTLRVVTFPITLIHILFSILYGFSVRLLYSMWLLFHGRKKNVLRQRVDTCDFDQNQLLFGVLLFAMLAFVLPNFAAYHYLFVLLRLIVVAIMYLGWQLHLLITDAPIIPFLCCIFQPMLLMQRAFLQMLLVREEAPKMKGGSPNFSMDNFEGFLAELSPKFGKTGKQKSLTPSPDLLHSRSEVLHTPPVISLPPLNAELKQTEETNETEDRQSVSASSPPIPSLHGSEVNNDHNNSNATTMGMRQRKSIKGESSDDESAAVIERIPSSDVSSPREPTNFFFNDSSLDTAGLTSGLSSSSASAFKSLQANNLFSFSLQGSTSLNQNNHGSSNSNSNNWRFASSKLSSTYIEITRRRIFVKDLFQGYLTWWSTFFLKQKSGLRIIQRIYCSQPLYIMLLRNSLSIIENEENEDEQLLRSAMNCLIMQTSTHSNERQILEMIIHGSQTSCPSLRSLYDMTVIAMARYDQALEQLSIPSIHPEVDKAEETRVAVIVNCRQQVVSRSMLWRSFIVLLIIIVNSCTGLFFAVYPGGTESQRVLTAAPAGIHDRSDQLNNHTLHQHQDNDLLNQQTSNNELGVKWVIPGVSHC